MLLIDVTNNAILLLCLSILFLQTHLQQLQQLQQLQALLLQHIANEATANTSTGATQGTSTTTVTVDSADSVNGSGGEGGGASVTPQCKSDGTQTTQGETTLQVSPPNTQI